MAANRAILTSHAPARGRIGAPPARAEASAHARSRPACSSRHAARQTRASTRRSRLDLPADRRACSASRVTGSCGVGAFSARVRHCAAAHGQLGARGRLDRAPRRREGHHSGGAAAPGSLYDRFVAFRERLGMEVLPHSAGASRFGVLAQRLRAGGLVALLCERDLTGSGIEVEFSASPPGSWTARPRWPGRPGPR